MRFGETEAADCFSLLQQRKPFVFLRVGAECVDGIHHERGLNGNKAAQAGIAAFKFLGDQAVFDVGHSRAAVAFQAGAEKTEIGHLRDELHRKFSFAVVLLDDGHDGVIDELTSGLASKFFLVAQQGIEVEEIDPGE